MYTSSIESLKQLNVHGVRCQVSGFRFNIGVSEVEPATTRLSSSQAVPTVLPVCENPKLAGTPLIDPTCSDHADHLTFSLTPKTRHLTP